MISEIRESGKRRSSELKFIAISRFTYWEAIWIEHRLLLITINSNVCIARRACTTERLLLAQMLESGDAQVRLSEIE